MYCIGFLEVEHHWGVGREGGLPLEQRPQNWRGRRKNDLEGKSHMTFAFGGSSEWLPNEYTKYQAMGGLLMFVDVMCEWSLPCVPEVLPLIHPLSRRQGWRRGTAPGPRCRRRSDWGGSQSCSSWCRSSLRWASCWPNLWCLLGWLKCDCALKMQQIWY